MGAIIATLIAELAMSCVQMFFVKGKVRFANSILKTIPYLVISAIMLIGVRIIAKEISFSLTTSLIVEVVSGIVIFSCLSVLYECITKKKIILNFIVRIGEGRE